MIYSEVQKFGGEVQKFGGKTSGSENVRRLFFFFFWEVAAPGAMELMEPDFVLISVFNIYIQRPPQLNSIPLSHSPYPQGPYICPQQCLSVPSPLQWQLLEKKLWRKRCVKTSQNYKHTNWLVKNNKWGLFSTCFSVSRGVNSNFTSNFLKFSQSM